MGVLSMLSAILSMDTAIQGHDKEHGDWCPQYAESCTEYGYCYPLVSWHSDTEHGDGRPQYAE